jgi:hypothetical protein
MPTSTCLFDLPLVGFVRDRCDVASTTRSAIRSQVSRGESPATA